MLGFSSRHRCGLGAAAARGPAARRDHSTNGSTPPPPGRAWAAFRQGSPWQASRTPRGSATPAAPTTPARDLGRYFAPLERERPGALVAPDEACLIRDALPRLREARRTGGDDATLAGAVAAHARAGGGAAYEVDVPTLVERLRGLSAVQLPAVIDVAERMNAAVLRGDAEGRERARRGVGVGG
jgi:hypothetical protein